MGFGGYKFGDYFRVGLPLTLLVAAVILLLLPLIYRCRNEFEGSRYG